jgi:hypothetical protein
MRTAAVGLTSRPPLVHAMFIALAKYRLLWSLEVEPALQCCVTRNCCRRRPPVVSAV